MKLKRAFGRNDPWQQQQLGGGMGSDHRQAATEGEKEQQQQQQQQQEVCIVLLSFLPRSFHPRITHSGVTARHLLVGESVHSAPLRLKVTRNDLRSLLCAHRLRRDEATASHLEETETEGGEDKQYLD